MKSSSTGIAQQVDSMLATSVKASRLGDDALRSRVVECEQAMLMLQAAQAEAMVQIGIGARAADLAEAGECGKPLWSRECHEQFVADELAVLLSCTKTAAATRYDTACRAADFPEVQKAWRAGTLDARKVAIIAEQVSFLPSSSAKDVAASAATFGQNRTAPQLREWLRRRVIAANPDAAEERRRRAMADRRVVITPGDDGMSELWALLPTVLTRQIQEGLTTAAQGAGSDDARSMDQRRADAMVDLLLGRSEPAAVTVHLIVDADTVTGDRQQPGWIPGLGAVTAGTVHDLVGGGSSDQHITWRRLLTDPTTGVLTDIAEKQYRPSAALDRAVRARDVTCRFPGCRRSADSAGTDVDHTIPWPQGPTAAANLAVLCRRHHRLKHTAGWTVALDSTGVMTWTTPTGRTHTTHPWQYTDPPDDNHP